MFSWQAQVAGMFSLQVQKHVQVMPRYKWHYEPVISGLLDQILVYIYLEVVYYVCEHLFFYSVNAELQQLCTRTFLDDDNTGSILCNIHVCAMK